MSEEELERLRIDFANGRMKLAIEEDIFDMRAYNAMVASVADEVQGMKERRRTAMAQLVQLEAQQVGRLDDLIAASGGFVPHSEMGGEGRLGGATSDVYAGRDGTILRAVMTGTV